MEKNANNKVNRRGLELATYNITFEWISGAWNKADECLFRLVELPHGKQATVQMLTATNHDGPTFNTRSRTAQCNTTEDLTPQHKTDTVTPDITTVTDTPDAMAKQLKIDYMHYYRCRGQAHSVSIFPSIYQIEKLQNMRLISFCTSKDCCINMLQIQTRSSWLLSYQKHRSIKCWWKFMTYVVTRELLTHTAS